MIHNKKDGKIQILKDLLYIKILLLKFIFFVQNFKKREESCKKKISKKKKRIEKYLIPDEIQIRKSPLLISASLGENIDALLLE